MLFFDIRGNLTPYTLIPTDWATFEGTFGWNQHRRALINDLKSLIEQISLLPILSFDLWIDGSFVTQKAIPNDLDLVLLLPVKEHRKFEKELRQLRDQFERLDAYLVRKIAEGEREYFLYASDRAEWVFQFSTTRPDKRTLRKYPKGFIEISWRYDEVDEHST
jgi:hypothetical protein